MRARSLLLKAVQNPQYEHFLNEAVQDASSIAAKDPNRWGGAGCALAGVRGSMPRRAAHRPNEQIADALNVNIGMELLKIVPGRVGSLPAAAAAAADLPPSRCLPADASAVCCRAWLGTGVDRGGRAPVVRHSSHIRQGAQPAGPVSLPPPCAALGACALLPWQSHGVCCRYDKKGVDLKRIYIKVRAEPQSGPAGHRAGRARHSGLPGVRSAGGRRLPPPGRASGRARSCRSRASTAT